MVDLPQLFSPNTAWKPIKEVPLVSLKGPLSLWQSVHARAIAGVLAGDSPTHRSGIFVSNVVVGS